MSKLLISGTLLQAKENAGQAKLELQEKWGMLVAGGRILATGKASELIGQADRVQDYGSALIVPGFIDTHVHFPQIDLIGAHAGDLLEWLENHTFPHEIKIIQQNAQLTRATARRFCQELYSNGTTYGVVFACSKEQATHELFAAFAETGGRLISGKISMDQNGPEPMLDTLEQDFIAHERLIKDWHNYDNRLSYAFSPRFALSCSGQMLDQLGQQAAQHPTTFIQTHYAENQGELAAVREQFAESTDYLAVYEDRGLVGNRTILAHGIHTSGTEKDRLARAGTIISHCPTSNLFLGSGLFAWQDNCHQGVKVCLGTDVGAGTSFSLWQTMGEAIKVSKLRGQQVSPADLLFAASLGAAQHLGQGSDLGSLEAGKLADFQVLDPGRKSLLQQRLAYCDTAEQIASALMFLVDSQVHVATWVGGQELWSAQE